MYCLLLGTFTVAIPLCLNGAAGASLHVPFPIVARSSFGFYFSRFAVGIRLITALFWHGMESILSFWKSYHAKNSKTDSSL